MQTPVSRNPVLMLDGARYAGDWSLAIVEATYPMRKSLLSVGTGITWRQTPVYVIQGFKVGRSGVLVDVVKCYTSKRTFDKFLKV